MVYTTSEPPASLEAESAFELMLVELPVSSEEGNGGANGRGGGVGGVEGGVGGGVSGGGGYTTTCLETDRMTGIERTGTPPATEEKNAIAALGVASAADSRVRRVSAAPDEATTILAEMTTLPELTVTVTALVSTPALVAMASPT